MHNNMQITKSTANRSASYMQQKAICHISGPARVLAGPGSGKTFTVIQRINYLVKEAFVPPDKILCITFTKAAALEMQERYFYQKKSECNSNENVHFGTIHSVCYHILKESGKFRQYSLIKESNKRKLLEMLLVNKGLKEFTQFGAISDILDAVSRKKNGLAYMQEEFLKEDLFEEIYTDYQVLLKERKLLDFDDMVVNCLQLLKENSYLCCKWQERFEYLLVDEFQDINEAQYSFIKLLAAPKNNLFVVGDDDQSIYGFRGAVPAIMEQFVTDYPDAFLLCLTENYRSGEQIVTFANKVIEQNIQRIVKNTIIKKTGGNVRISYHETKNEQEAQLLHDIKIMAVQEISQSAIIVRTNGEAAQYIALLKSHNISVREKKSENKSILRHFIREDFQAFLQFCHYGRKRSDFLKIMNKPEMYLSRQALTEETVTEAGLIRYYKSNSEMQKKIKKLFWHYERVKEMSFSMAIRYFRNVIKYDDYLKEKAINNREFEGFKRIADELLKLMNLQKNGENCETFFERMEYESEKCKDTDLKESGKHNQSNYMTQGISVITMHGAKGLEFKYVFLPDVNEGVIPGKQCITKESIEEERRLLYVAITRAKEFLAVYYTGERGRKPSRFLKGIIPHR